MSEPIDAVFTWVDGNNPAWLAKKARVMANEPRYSMPRHADVAKRYQECNELYYSIHLMRQNAPWIRNIFLVTDDQRPPWLDEATAGRLNVTVVDHKEIFVDHLDKLPTFNSQSIETMIVNIPQLAERFIYANDDMMIVRPVKPIDFFRGDQLIIRGRWGFKNELVNKILRRLTRGYSRRGYIGRRAGCETLPGQLRYVNLAHTPHGLFKSDFRQAFSPARTEQNISYRVRGVEQLYPIEVVANQARARRKAIRRNGDWEYLLAPDLMRIDRLDTYINNRNTIKFLCLNDLPELEACKIKRVRRDLGLLAQVGHNDTTGNCMSARSIIHE
jgi:hypothetical protein